MTDTATLDVETLCVTRGTREIGPLTFQAGPCEAVALVGPNGCGKTSLLLAILGLIGASRGRVRIFGREPEPTNPPVRTAYLPDRPVFWEGQSARANLEPFAADGADITEALERAGLSATLRSPVRTYSRGMKQRLGLARVLVARPELIVLDEPTIAVDESGVGELVALLRELTAGGATVLVSSHDASFVEGVDATVHQLSAK